MIVSGQLSKVSDKDELFDHIKQFSSSVHLRAVTKLPNTSNVFIGDFGKMAWILDHDTLSCHKQVNQN